MIALLSAPRGALTKRLCTVLALSFFLTTTAGAMSMIGFKSRTIYLFSGMKAQLLYQGKPVPNTQVTREYTWKKKTTTESTTTDANGFFEFPTATTSHVYKLVELSTRQRMYASYQGETIVFWYSSGIAYKEYAEFGGQPENMTCELSLAESDEKYPDIDAALISTFCSWQVTEADGTTTHY